MVRTIKLSQEDIKEAVSEWISSRLKDNFIPGKVTAGEVTVEVLFPEEALK